MRIIGPPSGDRPSYDRLVGMGATPLFIDSIVPSLWNAALSLTVDPIGVLAQSWKETGGGRFAGKVRPEFRNTCGLKVRDLGLFPGIDDNDNPLAHQRFPNWETGALAHVQHLRAYAGWPVEGLIVDPRYHLVSGQRCENFEDLSGKWALSATYGTELVAIARRLQA